MTSLRGSGRRADELRPVTLQVGAVPFAEGSCVVAMGSTRVLCAATVEESVPPWRQVGGWVTAEYSLLPRSTQQRTRRERSGARGRTQEIERLIGRSLRAAVDLEALGPRTIIVDCDVLSADGGTRTAAITGGCVALWQALERLGREGALSENPLRRFVAAVSVGIVDGVALLDLDYREDVGAEVDMNIAALDDGGIVEIQGTAEGEPFGRSDLEGLLDLAERGITDLLRLQQEAVGR